MLIGTYIVVDNYNNLYGSLRLLLHNLYHLQIQFLFKGQLPIIVSITLKTVEDRKYYREPLVGKVDYL